MNKKMKRFLAGILAILMSVTQMNDSVTVSADTTRTTATSFYVNFTCTTPEWLSMTSESVAITGNGTYAVTTAATEDMEDIQLLWLDASSLGYDNDKNIEVKSTVIKVGDKVYAADGNWWYRDCVYLEDAANNTTYDEFGKKVHCRRLNYRNPYNGWYNSNGENIIEKSPVEAFGGKIIPIKKGEEITVYIKVTGMASNNIYANVQIPSVGSTASPTPTPTVSSTLTPTPTAKVVSPSALGVENVKAKSVYQKKSGFKCVPAAKVTWDRNKVADGYLIYRTNSKLGEYEEVANVSNSSLYPKYIDKSIKKGKMYYYKIQAYVNGEPDITGEHSQEAFCKISSNVKKPKIQGSRKGNRLVIKFKQAEGAKYESQYRYPQEKQWYSFPQLSGRLTKKISCKIGKKGAVARYKVRVRTISSVNGKKVRSAWSNAVSVR